MTPLRWLHVTTLLAGPAADFSPDTLRQMTQTAAQLLANTPAAAVTLGQVLYHPKSHHARPHTCREADGDL
jgi:hypothetical protein